MTGENAMNERIAFLGTGLMGQPMAGRLLDGGQDVRLWNRSEAKLAPLVAAGGQAFASAAEAVAGATIVCLCLTDAKAVEDLLFGAAATADRLAPGAIIVDFSTIGPAATRDYAARVKAARGALWLDCPVSGGVAGAQAGTLAILAGGDADAIDRVRPLLALLSGRVTRMGDVGAGQAAKLCNQLIVATNMLAIAEAMHVGEALGIDLAQIPVALQGGFADSRPLQLFGPRMAPAVDPGPPVSELRTMYKDIKAIRAGAADVGAGTPLLANVEAMWSRLIDAGHGGEDVPGLMRLYREQIDVGEK
jgi:3-hydroxyisobutyrate dehydrogenase-like beta-hydroxyacid dehydrogenase